MYARLIAILLGFLALPGMTPEISARQKDTPIGCKSWGDIPDKFLQNCLLSGGTEVRCSSGKPMCCKKTKKSTHCYADINDMPKTSAPTTPDAGTIKPRAVDSPPSTKNTPAPRKTIQ